MAKTIKFNLICDGNPVRTIEDLQNNFSIEDILEYYKNKLLHRWLEVRGYSDHLKKVEMIMSSECIEIIRQLIEIFDIEIKENEILEKIYILEYTDNRNKKNEKYNNFNKKVNLIIDDYFIQYENLKKEIVIHKKDISFLKASCKKISNDFLKIFDMDYFDMIRTMIDECPMFIYIMLTDSKLRKYMLVSEMNENSSTVKKENIKTINYLITLDNFFDKDKVDEILEKNVIVVSGPTDEYWKDAEPKNKKVMVIRAGNKIVVRNAGKTGEEINHEDYMGKFLILNGLDYKCNENHTLRYMEV